VIHGRELCFGYFKKSGVPKKIFIKELKKVWI